MSESTIDVSTLRKMLERGEPVTVLDVRPTEEREEWMIPGSLHVDAYARLKAGDPDALAGLELPEERPVVAVCGAGKTSQIAAEELRNEGLPAFSLEGGMKAWSLAWNRAEVPLQSDKARVIQVRRTGKGCLSYVIGAEGEAFVIDAAVAPDVYLELARENGWRIAGILDTHIHADHLSRSRQLAAASGAPLYLPANERATYPFTPVHDDDILTVGGVSLEVLATAGHTDESVSYLLDEQALFTGDTLFLSGVGRPDLEASREGVEQHARALYHSLQRILALPADTLILPAHTAEPVAFDREPVVSELRHVRDQVRQLHLSEADFVAWLLDHLPATPPNHERIISLNESGRWPEGEVTNLEAGANRCAIS